MAEPDAITVRLDISDEAMENEEKRLRLCASQIKATLVPIEEKRKQLFAERQKQECLLATLKAELSNKLQAAEVLKAKLENLVMQANHQKEEVELLSTVVTGDNHKLLELELNQRELQIVLLKNRMALMVDKSTDSPLRDIIARNEKDVAAVEAEIKERLTCGNQARQDLEKAIKEQLQMESEEKTLNSQVAEAEAKIEKGADNVVSAEKKLQTIVEQMDALLEQRNFLLCASSYSTPFSLHLNLLQTITTLTSLLTLRWIWLR